MAIDLTSPESLAFGDYMRANGYWFIVPIDDENYACLCQFAYTCAILKGRWGDRTGYDDRWCFHDAQAATEALVNWFIVDIRDPEPSGWHRHTPSHRRRPDGDPTKEYVAA
jgi:hypothetical protein